MALLRGVNVGGRNVVPMAGLRALFEETGCAGVRSYIQSGNVVFERAAPARDALAAELERAVSERFGVAPRVVLRTAPELAALVAAHPFDDGGAQTHVAFLAETPGPEAVARVEALDVAPDEVVVAGSDVYLRFPDGYANARVTAAVLERVLGVPGTARNWRTVTTLAALAAE